MSSPASSPPTVRTLVDEFLAEQQATTAVERFAAWHDDTHPRTEAYRDLLPATPPGPGQQYAFEVDLDACSGCKACVVACGSLNGLPDGASFRRTGTLVGTRDELPVVRTVTSACHHCAEPGCLTGCPADAYEKDPVTGVVRHLDDQCIGCQYCTLTCPYEVPAFDADRGIVRKCDLCHERLAVGEAPACVQACPTEAIAIRTVALDDVHAAADTPWPLPSPDPATTVPSTRYRTSEALRDGVVATDAGAPALAHAHPPLTVMLVLTQVAVGTSLAVAALPGIADVEVVRATTLPATIVVLLTAVVALAASVLHLGRPWQAWRAVLGLRHSWLSREIVAFGAFAGLTTAATLTAADVPTGAAALAGPTAFAASSAGLVGVGTSVMVYAVCGRRWWSAPRTGARFAATTALGGLAVLLALVTVVGAVTGVPVAELATRVAVASTVVAVAVVAAEVALLLRARGPADDEVAATARVLVRHLPGVVVTRLAGSVVGAVLAPWLAVGALTIPRTSPTAAAVVALLGLGAVVVGELADRWRFFTAVAPVRMPGGAR